MPALLKARSTRVAGSQRDWTLAVFGRSCATLGVACVLLAACNSNLAKPRMAMDAPAPVVSTVATVIPAPAVPTPATPPEPFWVALRARFAMPDCDYDTTVMTWARWYTKNPSGFALSLRQSMPFLMLVADRLAQHGIPAEFAFLPYIESNYTALDARGNRAAGIWQLIPDTAREAGLHVGRHYDGRLDVSASTDAAIKLLARYHDVFDSWRLADMAFNAGEYAVRKRFDGEHATYSASELAQLRVQRGTHEHLAKLLAMACIARNPARFEVQLPEPADADFLLAVDFPAAVDLQLAARLAGMDATRLRQFNPGYRNGRMPEGGPYRLLVPRANEPALQASLAKIPQALWGDWHERTLRRTQTLGVLAGANAIDVSVLTTVNGNAAGTQLAAGTTVLLPGRGTTRADAAPRNTAATISGTHVVRAGDTLWDIAREAHVSVRDLRRWNDLAAASRLHIGQRLRLHAAEADPETSAVAASAH